MSRPSRTAPAVEQGGAHLGQGGDLRGGGAGCSGAQLAFHKTLRLQTGGKIGERGFVGEVDAGLKGRHTRRAIEPARVHMRQAVMGRPPFGDCALAGGERSVDCDNHGAQRCCMAPKASTSLAKVGTRLPLRRLVSRLVKRRAAWRIFAQSANGCARRSGG